MEYEERVKKQAKEMAPNGLGQNQLNCRYTCNLQKRKLLWMNVKFVKWKQS